MKHILLEYLHNSLSRQNPRLFEEDSSLCLLRSGSLNKMRASHPLSSSGIDSISIILPAKRIRKTLKVACRWVNVNFAEFSISRFYPSRSIFDFCSQFEKFKIIKLFTTKSTLH